MLNKQRYGTSEGNDVINKCLASNKGVFNREQEQVIRFWGQWNGDTVMYSSKKAARILGITPQTVQNWCKRGGKWGKDVKFDPVLGYQIKLDLIVDETKLMNEYGKRHNLQNKLFMKLDDIDKCN